MPVGQLGLKLGHGLQGILLLLDAIEHVGHARGLSGLHPTLRVPALAEPEGP